MSHLLGMFFNLQVAGHEKVTGTYFLSVLILNYSTKENLREKLFQAAFVLSRVSELLKLV